MRKFRDHNLEAGGQQENKAKTATNIFIITIHDVYSDKTIDTELQ